MRGLSARIALGALAATSSALLTMLVLVGPGLRQRALDRMRDRLTAEAKLLSPLFEEPLSRGAGPDEIDPRVDALAAGGGPRVTVLDPTGRVLGDSALSGSDLLAREPEGNQPEVREALASGIGRALRPNTPYGEEYLYVAAAVRQGARVVGVVRVALPGEMAEAQVHDLYRAAWAALALALVVTAVVSAVLASSLGGGLSAVKAGAQQLASGNLDARIPVRKNDAMGELATLLNRAVEQVQTRLSESARDRVRTDAILSAMEDGVLAVDDRGIVLLANDILRRNLELQEPVGHHYVEVIRQREVGEVLQDILKTGGRRAVEVPIRHMRRVYALTGVPFPGAQGMPHGAVLTFHDVTERRRLEQVRRDFVANASHELRTPLTSIRGFVEALEDGALVDPRTADRFLGKIRIHADRMAALVEDLLELSRLESGERHPRWEEVSPSEIAEDVVASFARVAERRNTGLTYSNQGGAPVMTDADRLRRILENLVDNALKYTPSGGQVELSTAPGRDGGVILEVRDNGPGIPADHLSRIFERFYRVDKARSREMGGTGLGLAIVKHLAEGMGASVTVKSEVGRGTCFSVQVPARVETPLS